MTSKSSGPSAILAALAKRRGEALSGEALSDLLGVTRAQVWKNVEVLRKRGYEIAGEPGGGYRLHARPDRLYAEELTPRLRTRWLARRIEHFDEIDSTNRVAFDLGREGAEAGTTVIAESQNAGRGRLGRVFYSPANLNLYTSVLLRPTGSIADAPTLILGAAVAVAETVATTLGDEASVAIKWPNDVLIAGRKTSGILMESSAEGTRLAFAVLGIGINLNVDRNAFPDEFRSLATSLSSELARPVDRIAFTQLLFENLEMQLDAHASGGFEAIRPRFEDFFRMRDQPVGVEELGGQRIDGIARRIAPNGALEIEIKDGPRAGESIRVLAGDVTLAKPDPSTPSNPSPSNARRDTSNQGASQ